MSILKLGLVLAGGPSPMRLGIARDGTLYSGRFYGRYRIRTRTLETDLRGGCYNDANSSAVTSVALNLAAGAPQAVIRKVEAVLTKEGWPAGKISVTRWANAPNMPR
jgi:hypothetical protein